MKDIAYKIFKMVLLIAVFVLLAGCNYDNQLTSKADAKETIGRAAWLAYWDLDAGGKDLQRIGKKLGKLSYFGAYFDAHDRMFIPQELSDKRKELKAKKEKYETYLTFINDKQNADESVIMKDIEVLRRIFATTASMDRHIDDLIALTLQGKYDGIEIDYERIWNDEQIAKSFSIFVDKLYKKAGENKLKLRVVLEPGTPFSIANLPQGPEYVVMFYNLYGLHSEPGPKANRGFIEKTVRQMKALRGETSVAFATGGCLWGDNGKRSLLSEAEAKTLAVTQDSKTQRDEESQCIVFEYQDMGVSYQVWYADVETLNYWIGIAKEQGVNNISIWRLGGNIDINKIE
ncbi:hypothetical protein SPSIL_012930 [Sporomusa silvacetica DSM 10669]|uniref:GH18 domain-containing protein n=1 Tax=Sporomusa silvacetica DSM 10669 TaxID=1123289 RepID=A0ABZ3IHP2_9FIRM|nr:hypothetical protein SPSIL_32240 [Sporomusa silvacetica DSM 10669]